MSFGVLIICLFLIVCSAFLSSSEAALFSLSRYQIRSLRDRVPRAYRTIKRITADPAGLLMTLLISNEILNISISTLIANALFGHERLEGVPTFGLPAWAFQTLVGILVTAPIILILCEITPKVIGARANQMLAILFSGPIAVLYDLLSPFRTATRWILVRLHLRKVPTRQQVADAEEARPRLQEEDFLVMVEEGHRQGDIHESELDLIRNVFELDDTTAAEIQTPFSQVTSVLETLPVKDAVRLTQTWKFSRIPVLSPDRRRVTGVLYRKDLLLARLSEGKEAATVSEVMRKPLVLQSSTKIHSVFRKLKQHQTHIAIIENAERMPTGVVTMADVLNELFDDLFEERPW